MAKFLQKENLFILWSDDFFFFRWKIENSDVNSNDHIKSPKFNVQGRETYLKIVVGGDEDDDELYLYVPTPGFVDKLHVAIIISDKENSVIHSCVETREFTDELDLLEECSSLSPDTEYPMIIMGMSKYQEDLSNESLINSLDSLHLNSLTELSSDLKKALDQNMHSDVVLNIEGDTTRAHKVILRARSPVFHKMFSNDLLEAAVNEVVISDIGAETIKRLLSYMYTGTVGKCSFEEFLELFYAADKYEVLSLRDICKTELLKLLKNDNACTLFALAVRHSEEDLKEQVVRFVSTNLQSVVELKSFTQLSKDDMTLLVRLCLKTPKP